MSKRIQKVNQLIKKELSQIILREVEFPAGVLATLTRVESSPNLAEGRVYISVLPEKMAKRTLEILNRMIYELQHRINRRLNMRPIPRLRFVEEKKMAEAGRIEEILEGLKKDE